MAGLFPSVPFITLPRKRWAEGMEKKERLGIYDDLSDSEGGDEYYDDYYSDEDGGASTIQNSRTRGSGSGSRYSGSQSYVEGSQRSRSQSQSQSRQSFSRKSGSILPVSNRSHSVYEGGDDDRRRRSQNQSQSRGESRKFSSVSRAQQGGGDDNGEGDRNDGDNESYYDDEEYGENDDGDGNSYEQGSQSIYDEAGGEEDEEEEEDDEWYLQDEEESQGGLIELLFGPLLEWRRKLRDKRIHYILLEYEQRVKAYDRKMKKKIREEMKAHERAVALEAYRAMKRRKANNFGRRNKVAVTVEMERNLSLRDRERTRMEFHCGHLPDWAVERTDERELARHVAVKDNEKAKKLAIELERKEERRKLIHYEMSVLREDHRVSQQVLTMMRQIGLREGVNVEEHGVLPCMIPMSIVEQRLELKLKKGVDFSEWKKKKKPVKPKYRSIMVKSKSLASGVATNPEDAAAEAERTKNINAQAVDAVTKGNGDINDATMVALQLKAREAYIASEDGDEDRFNPFNVDLTHSARVLDLQCYQIGERGALCLAAELIRGACPNVENLSFAKCEIRTRGLGRLLHGMRVGNLGRLVSLDLRGNFIGPRGLDYLREVMRTGTFDNLREIDLRENELGDDGATAIVRLIIAGTLKNITTLHLQNNGITDVGFSRLYKALQTLQPLKCPNLEQLALEGNSISAKIKRECSPLPPYITI